MKKCEICGTAMNDDVAVCPECGSAVKATTAERTCPICGAAVADGKKFCPQCGAKMPEGSGPLESGKPVSEKKPIRSKKSAEHPTPVDNATPVTEVATDAASADKLCPICGATVAAGKKFCPQCGVKMAEDKASEAYKPVTAKKPVASKKSAEQPTAVVAPVPEVATDAASEDKLCPICGATVAAGKKFCPQCGAKMAEEKKAVEQPAPVSTAAAAVDKICNTCGAVVAAGKKFCPNCGTKIVEEKKPEAAPAHESLKNEDVVCGICGTTVAFGKRFCPNCGSKVEQKAPVEEQKRTVAFCPECGTKIEGVKKFCPNCGTPISVSSTSATKPVTKASDYKPTGEAATAVGKIRQLLPTVGIMLTLILTVVFMFVPFLSVKMSVMGMMSETVKQPGVTGLGVLFTGNSDLIAGGANEIVMRMVGAGYILLILALIWYILFAISSVFRYNSDTIKHQVIMSVILTAVSLLLMVLSIIARIQVNESIERTMGGLGSSSGIDLSSYIKTSWFMGAVGLFAVNAVMLVYAIVMRVIYKPTLDRPALTPELLKKPVRGVLTLVDVLVLIACIVVPIVTGCSSTANNPNRAKEIKDYDTFTITCNESYTSDELYGSTVYYNLAYFEYTPGSDGTVRVEIVNATDSYTSMAVVDIAEYGEIIDIYDRYGNEGVIDELSGNTYATCNVEADIKYCIVFGAVSLKKNDKIEISYTFDDGGTRGGNGGNGGSSQITGGSTRSNAVAIPSETDIATGSIYSGDSSWYKFTPTESGAYKIASSRYNGDPDLHVFDSLYSETNIGEDRDSGGFNKDFVFIAGNTYYIEIYAYTNNTSCTFKITKYADISMGSSRETAIPVTLDESYSTGNIASNSSMWYKFTPSEDGRYRLATSSYTGSLNLNVYDHIQTSYPCANEGDGGDFDQTVYMYGGTTYYIEIAAFGNSSCTFSVTDPYQERREATRIADLGTMYSASVEYGKSAWFSFTPIEDARYDINIGGVFAPPTINLKVYDDVDDDYNIDWSNGNDDFVLTRDLIAGYTYFFEIYFTDSNWASTGCTISVNIARGVTRDTAILLDLDDEATLSDITNNGTWYQYTPHESGTYLITARRYTGDPDVKVYDSISSNSTVASNTNSGWTDVEVVMSSNKTYYINIYFTGSVTFSLIRVPETYAARKNANSITLGASYSTGTIYSGQYKWYKFIPTYSYDAYLIKTSQFSGDPDLYVYDSLVAIDPIGSDTTDNAGFGIAFKLTQNATYYIGIKASDNYAASCTFRVSNSAGNNSGGSSRSIADEIVLNATYRVGSMNAGSSAWFKYVPKSTSTVNIGTTSYNGEPNLRVYSGSSQSANYSENFNAGFNKSMTLYSGTEYFIEIYAGTNLTSCDFRFETAGASRQSAIELSRNVTTMTGTIEEDGSKWYKFTPTVSASYRFHTTSYTGHMIVYIYVEDEASFTWIYNNGDGFDKTVPLDAGTTYYIQIDSHLGAASANFSVT